MALNLLLSSQLFAKTRPRADCGSDHELLIAKFRLKLNKVGKITRPFRYDLNQIPYDYTLGSIQPADRALLLETLLTPSPGLVQPRKLKPQGLSPLLSPPNPLAIPALWLCQHHGTPWGLGFLPYKKGVAISTSQFLLNPMQGFREL